MWGWLTAAAFLFGSAVADEFEGDKKSGSAFLTPESRALQNDDFENPGMLWVGKGEKLFHDKSGGKPCAECHTDKRVLKGAATRYPAIDEKSGKAVNLEGRINMCRQRYQNASALPYESEDLLAMTAYVASLSRGLPMSPAPDVRLKPYIARGKKYFFKRRGQFNLACTHCHDKNWGKKLRGDTISQGHGNGFPAYRFEWQTLGSLHRRLHDCDVGVRAEPFALGSPEYLALEVFLATRARGLPIETPAVRR